MSKKKILAEIEERVTVLEQKEQAARQRRHQLLFNTAAAIVSSAFLEGISILAAFLQG